MRMKRPQARGSGLFTLQVRQHLPHSTLPYLRHVSLHARSTVSYRRNSTAICISTDCTRI